MTAALRLDADARTPGLDVGLDARDHAGDVGAVERLSRSSGVLLAPGPAKPRATITFGVVEPGVPFGKPGGIREAGRVEELMLVVDAVVDDGHLDAVTARARQPRERESCRAPTARGSG